MGGLSKNISFRFGLFTLLHLKSSGNVEVPSLAKKTQNYYTVDLHITARINPPSLFIRGSLIDDMNDSTNT